MPTKCKTGCGKNAILKRPKTGDALCRPCFFWAFETEVHNTIVSGQLFQPGQHVALCASGGKDSTVLAHVLNTLNQRYNYGLQLTLLSIDEGITGYRDDSLATVRRNRDQYGLPLTILSYKDLYGWSMDDIVRETGRRNNCTFCGVLRRQAFERGASLLGADVLATGHNADDVAETVLMNVLRGDVARLRRCTALTTGSDGSIPRCKPFKYTYEKEIVMYAYFKRLDYFSTECTYSPNAYRGYARAFLKDLEAIRPTCIMDILHSGERLAAGEAAVARLAARGTCQRCGHVSSQPVCQACTLLHGLNQGTPRLGVGKSSKVGHPGSIGVETPGPVQATSDTQPADATAGNCSDNRAEPNNSCGRKAACGARTGVGTDRDGKSEAASEGTKDGSGTMTVPPGCVTKPCCGRNGICAAEMENGHPTVNKR